MEFTVKSGTLNPATDLNDPEGNFQRVPDVVYSFCTAVRRPSYYDYDELLKAACDRMGPVVEKLFHLGYRIYVFMVGVALDAERLAKIPNYDLWSKASRYELSFTRKIEKDLTVIHGRRRIGLYEVDTDRFLDAIRYQSKTSDCIICLSKEARFLSDSTAADLYRLARVDEGRRFARLHWGTFVRELCGQTHVIAQEHGQFDDLERGLTICASKTTWASVSDPS